MKINTTTSLDFPSAAATESNATLGNVTIVQANKLGETNYLINDEGTIVEASFDLQFTLATALQSGYRLGFYLDSYDSLKTSFTYSTDALTVDTTTFFAATENNSFDKTAIWQAAGTSLGTTQYTIPVTIKYTSASQTPGDSINLKAYFFVYDGSQVTNDNIASDNVTVTVYTSTITPTVTTLDASLVSKIAFNLGDTIVFKTTLTPTATNEFYKKSVAIDFKQTIPESTLITINNVYASVNNIDTGTGGIPQGLSPLTSAFAGSEVSYVFNAADFPAPEDETVIPELYVWVSANIKDGPSVPACPTA